MLVCILLASAVAQLPNIGQAVNVGRGYGLQEFGTKDGLPSQIVRAAEVDADGFLWLGTMAGLARYDGREFRVFQSARTPGLDSDRILAVEAVSNGELWIGTDDGVVVRTPDGRFRPLPDGEDLGSIDQIFEAADGRLWLAGSQLATWWEGRLSVLHDLAPVGRHQFFGVTQAVDGTIWVASSEGLFRSDGSDLECVAEGVHHWVVPDFDGNVWAYSKRTGLSCSGEPREGDPALGAERIWDVVDHEPRRRLIATTAGLRVMQPSGAAPGFEFVDAGLSMPRSLALTASGGIFAGTEQQGLIYLERRYVTEFVVDDRVAGRSVSAVHALPDGTILAWFAGAGGTLCRLARDGSVETIAAPSVAFLEIEDAAVGPDGVIWLATGGGLATLAGSTVEPVPDWPAATRPLRIAPAAQGQIWCRTHDATIEWLPGRGVGRTVGAAGPTPTRMLARRGRLVQVEADRVVAFDTSTTATTELFRIPGAVLRQLFYDEHDDLWVTTYGQGLWRKRADGRVDHWSIRDGLPDTYLGWIDSARAEDGREFLWLNSNSGVIRVDLASLDAHADGMGDLIECRLFDSPEGNGSHGARVGPDLLVLPTIVGPILVDTGASDADLARPIPRVESLEVDGRLLADAGTIRGSMDLTARYSAIQFPRSQGTRFQYQLMGLDADWVDAGDSRVVRFQGLGPGEYRFRLRARGPSQNWSLPVSAGTIEVVPLWYQRSSARVLGIVAVLLLTRLVVLVRTRGLKRRGDALAREVRMRKAAEEHVRASELRYRNVLNAASDGIVSVDENGQVVFSNHALSRMLRVPLPTLVGSRAADFGLGGLLQRGEAILAHSEDADAAPLEPFAMEVSRPDGSQLDVELTAAAERNSEGGKRVTGVVRDIGERKRMMDRVAKSESRFRTLFNATPTAILGWTPEYTIIDWNQRAVDLFGWTTGPPKGIEILDLLDERVMPRTTKALLDEVIEGGKESTVTLRTRVTETEVRRCRWLFAPLADSDGSIRAVISLIVDVSREEAMAQSMEELRRRIARAEETERSRIARELHDDLSQRLAALSLEAQLAQNSAAHATESERSAILARIQVGLEAIARDVHALSRRLHPGVLDDLGLLRALRSECSFRQRLSGVRIRFENQLGDFDLEIDDETSLSLFRIAQESIQNAVKHASATSITTTVRLEAGLLVLETRDNGRGIDRSANDQAAWRGLGLASMRERARLIDGEIAVHSVPGEGTVVSVTVPFSSAADEPGSSEVTAIRVPSPS